MDSDYDIDMSWVDLAAGKDKSLKRAMSASSKESHIDAKRSKTECVGISVVVQTEGGRESMRHGFMEAVLDEDVRMEGVGMGGDELAEETLVDEKTEYEETGGVTDSAEDTKVREEREGIRVEKQRERDEKTAFWTTPGLRPLAEPPIPDWNNFFRVNIPSDLRYKMLFPNDPEKRCMTQDTHGEVAVLAEYMDCLKPMGDNLEITSERRAFYENLYGDLYEDWQEVDTEYAGIYYTATELSRFEFNKLDNDGRTTELEKWINKGADVFQYWGDEVREKYRHLVPSDFVENRLATHEFYWLDWGGGPTMIDRMARERSPYQLWVTHLRPLRLDDL